MQPPRWFYVTLAACAVILTLTASYVMIARRNVGRWVPVAGMDANDVRALDSSTGIVCAMTVSGSACLDLPMGVAHHQEKRDADHP